MQVAKEMQELPTERHAETIALLALVQTVHDSVQSLHTDVKNLDGRLSTHMTTETHELATEITKLMTSAFPDGDPDGHRRHHEAVIEREEARAAFWKKMFFELSKYGLIAFLGWLVLSTWNTFLQGPHK